MKDEDCITIMVMGLTGGVIGGGLLGFLLGGPLGFHRWRRWCGNRNNRLLVSQEDQRLPWPQFSFAAAHQFVAAALLMGHAIHQRHAHCKS